MIEVVSFTGLCLMASQRSMPRGTTADNNGPDGLLLDMRITPAGDMRNDAVRSRHRTVCKPPTMVVCTL